MGLFWILLLTAFSMSHFKAPLKINKKDFWLSYIPPIDVHFKIDLMTPVCIKKINFFDTDEVDPLASIERLMPVIDKVVYVPEGLHEFSHLSKYQNLKNA
jgi:hypothetical protein